MNKSCLMGVVCAFLLVSSSSISAAIVKYKIEGTVGAIDTPLLGGPVNVGDIVTGSFLAETNSTNQGPSFISYTTSDLILNIGNSYTVTSPEGYIYVHLSSFSDRIQIDFTQGLGLTGPTINGTWSPDYFNSQYIVDGDDYSPNSLPSVIDVSQPYIGIHSSNLRFNVDDNVEFYFNLTEITAVPIPATALLFGSGLLGLIGIARKKAA